jgi:hypothetical protein
MSKQSKQKKIREFNDHVFNIYNTWAEQLNEEGLLEEVKALFKELPQEKRKTIAKEILEIVELKKLELETGVKVINVNKEGTHDKID